MSKSWSAKRILAELCDGERRNAVLVAFWKGADDMHRRLAAAHLAKQMHFREETIRKASPEKKAEWLGARVGTPELQEFGEAALLAYHTKNARAMMAAFLDSWGIPHADGSIEADDYTPPTREAVLNAVASLEGQFPLDEIILYLATAGLLMGQAWQEATWPVVDDLRAR
ncbi:MAG: hypothetical protein ACYC7A_19340 [Thermoanaerobaculia bacterium]